MAITLWISRLSLVLVPLWGSGTLGQEPATPPPDPVVEMLEEISTTIADSLVPAAQEPGTLPAVAALASRTPEQEQDPLQDSEEGAKGTGGFELTPSDKLEFHARNLDLVEAFAQLRMLTHRNIIVSADVKKTFSGDLYDVDVDEAIQILCVSTGLVIRDEGTFLFIEAARTVTQVFSLDYARAEDVLKVITPMLTKGTGAATATESSKQGISSSQTEAGGNDYAFSDVIVAHDFAPVLERIAEVIATLDEEPRQVLIEATILSAQLNNGMEAGIDFTALLGVDFQSVGATSSDGNSLDFGPIGSNDLTDGVTTLTSGVAGGIATGGLNLGFIQGNTAAFLRALESITDTVILANPKIVTLNKQRGEVLLGRRDGFLTTTVTQTSTTQTVEYLETGTRLIFRPFIAGNGKVRLEIHPEDSEGGINGIGLPFKETAEVTTNILVRSGETVVIGGLFREKVGTTKQKVPILGDIPIIGAAFRSTKETSAREEIVILLTPHILEISTGKTDESPKAMGGFRSADQIPLRQVYRHTVQALALDRKAGSAFLLMSWLDDVLPLTDRGAIELKTRIHNEVIPSSSGELVDDRILRDVLRNMPSGSAKGDSR